MMATVTHDVMRWVDDQLAQDATLRAAVETRLAELRLEQQLVELREARGLTHRPGRGGGSAPNGVGSAPTFGRRIHGPLMSPAMYRNRQRGGSDLARLTRVELAMQGTATSG
jgi:hypothetical protein